MIIKACNYNVLTPGEWTNIIVVNGIVKGGTYEPKRKGTTISQSGFF